MVCQSILKRTINVETPSVFFLLIFGLFSILHFQINKKKMYDYCVNQSHLKLTSRLQLRHSLDVTEMLLPAIALHVVLVMGLVAVVSWLVYSTPGLDYTPTKHGIQYLCHFCMVLYIVIHPLICFQRCRYLRQELRKLFRISNRLYPERFYKADLSDMHPPLGKKLSRHIGEVDAGTVHFMLLERMWQKS